MSEKPETLDEFVDSNTGQLESHGLVVKKRAKTKLAKIMAEQISTSIMVEKFEILGEQIYAVDGKTGYAIMLTSTPKNYKNDKKIFDAMVHSFVIKKKKK